MEALVASLSNSFRRVPPEAIPAVLECILLSAESPPSSLFSLLLKDFPNLAKDILKGSEKLNSEQSNRVVSFVSALCHLLKKSGANTHFLRLFIWKILIPLMKLVYAYDRGILNQTAILFFDVVAEQNNWGVVEATMVPFFLRLIGLSVGMFQSEEFAIHGWSILPDSRDFTDTDSEFSMDSNVHLSDLAMSKVSVLSHSWSFPLSISCHILTLTVDAALQSKHAVQNSCKIFAGNLLWDLCSVTVQMLSQSLEHRSCATNVLLPSILKAFVTHCAFEVSIHGQAYILSRKDVFMKIWKSCTTLFSLGPLERRDAYAILSLYFSYFSHTNGCEGDDTGGRETVFDLTAEKKFWDEIRKGLVDRESLVRKQSLHILKTVTYVNEENQCNSGVSGTMSNGKSLVSRGMTKRERWAEKEAKSLGVGKICSSIDFSLNSQQTWQAFFLLYEMLDEYGTHLVEAAWNHQMDLLLHSFFSCEDSVNFVNGGFPRNQIGTLDKNFMWLAVLWERGFSHNNPQVRCLIMQSFLGVDWKNCEECVELVPEDFVLGPFIQGLNDPVHHKDFGIKGVYSSKTIEGATKFLYQYSTHLDVREMIAFLSNLASFAKKHSFGRAGLMGLVECIASAARGVQTHIKHIVEWCQDASSDMVQAECAPESSSDNDKVDLLENLRFIIETSKQHFNPNYRLQVCEKILDAVGSVMSALDVPLELFLHFISTMPQELTDYGGSLREKLQKWFPVCHGRCSSSDCCCTRRSVLKNLGDFLRNFVSHHHSIGASVTYDDEDLEAWRFEAKRWARLFFLVVNEEQHLDPILLFIQDHATDIYKKSIQFGWVPVKFLILLLSLVQELQVIQERIAECGIKARFKSEFVLPETVDYLSSTTASVIFEKFAKLFLLILDELVSFAKLSCSIFWSDTVVEDMVLPGSIKGKLGGPSQRRLSSSVNTSVLQAITSVKAVAALSCWCSQFTHDIKLESAVSFLWQLSWRIISSPTCNSENEAEILLAAYEALAYALKKLVSMFSPLALDLIESDKLLPAKAECKPLVDSFVWTFLHNINNLIAFEDLVRTRRAILMDWKWICLESLLSIPNNAHKNGVLIERGNYFFSDGTVRWIFGDLVDSLENAGEGSVLPMLRSVRLILELFVSGWMVSAVSSCCAVDAQLFWPLVHSSWILHVSLNKRRVAPIAALLSSVLHYSVFHEVEMHEIDNAPGPLKWFAEKLLEEGRKSPRTIRLVALHLTGLWLANPGTIKYYMKELKLLIVYGSVAFDEDFEAELIDNLDARSEVLVLAKSPDPDLTEEFINTELYARVSVAVLFYKLADLADMVGSINENEKRQAALEAGKMFLLELLESVVTDKDLSKELYKKYSAVHRRKIRVWQTICILSRFVDEDIIQKVSNNLHISLYRNNLPSVRQYLETFAIHIYLKFPSLVGEQLVSLFRDYDMRPQALSSYVFVAANVILHANEAVQSRHLGELLPPIIPLLTSHHHTLRGFTQLLVYKVLQKLLPSLELSIIKTVSLEKRCFEDLKLYLEDNSDCARLRASMEGYLDAFDPKNSISPAGIFSNRVEELEFECVPTSLMERVIAFLNDAREDLRCSMAKDATALKNEKLRIDGDPRWMEIPTDSKEEELLTQLPKDIPLDFQKKVSFSKHVKQDTSSSFFLGNKETHRSLMDLEKEDLLLDHLLHSRSVAMEELRASRQQFILVASLLDRIPNLAGLARTCEVFKAAGLAIADTSMLQDKQFQLISVTAEKWVPIVEVPVSGLKFFLEKQKLEGFTILGLEQTAKSIPLDQYMFPKKMVLVLGREKEGIPVEIIHILDACIEIPQLGVVRSLNVHVSGAIALWEYTRQQRSQ